VVTWLNRRRAKADNQLGPAGDHGGNTG
jgi:hypothetical protein